MKLFFVNVECQVRKETREFTAQQSADKPYRTFTFAVVAATAREALNAVDSYDSENWHEIKRYCQNPEGNEPGEAVFNGCSDHDRKHLLAA